MCAHFTSRACSGLGSGDRSLPTDGEEPEQATGDEWGDANGKSVATRPMSATSLTIPKMVRLSIIRFKLKESLPWSCSGVEIALMHRLKRAGRSVSTLHGLIE